MKNEMTSRPIILVSEGCSMSSWISLNICELLIAHNYHADRLSTDFELYKPEKNSYFVEGMNTIALLDKTFSVVPNITIKLPINEIIKDGMIDFLLSQNSRICFIERENLLDVAICSTKDFIDPPEVRKSFDKFGEWRKSPERLRHKVRTESLIDTIDMLAKRRMLKKDIMYKMSKTQNEFICAEKLCNLCFDEFARLFQILEFELDRNIFSDFFSDTEIKKPYKHETVIDTDDVDSFKNQLNKCGYLQYWRD
jgi:hypothetical protein